ncbi:MAG: hypothetical protein QN173_09705 [Armatimonadota bacterium]|nr:hypothetical protein [Armatimonadota bacterium]MDR7401544.1 hypothetical protein [Armatimonadota bacterium]MDR7403286.1 hypothetical protein [Armatimonadota bacterium]MDR7437644.1 hypothetical protein [Armatimonadota bacterium]MDR7471648.1 hypothetical protein [Armatimonadota bacterium]
MRRWIVAVLMAVAVVCAASSVSWGRGATWEGATWEGATWKSGASVGVWE